MTGLLVPTAAPRRRWFTAGLMLGVIAVFAAVAAGAVLDDRTSSPSSSAVQPDGDLVTQQAAFARFEEAVDRMVRDGGFLVTQGMQPGISDINQRRYDDDTLAGMARGWRASMRSVRAEFAAVQPPAFLAETARLYDEALAGYVEVADALLAATQATGARRATLLDDEVPRLGEAADRLWEAAQAELERHRDRLGAA